MQNISTSTGYNTDFDSIYEWKVTPNDDDETAMNIKDGPDDIESDPERVLHTHLIHYELEVTLSDGASTVDNARNAIQDIYKALQTSTGLCGKQYKLWPEGDDIAVDQAAKKVAVATIKFAVQCTTAAWQSTILNY
jgi:hypothetical protein